MGSALRLPVMSQIADKLKRARLATGMSTRAVAARVSKRLGISHATIANYEKGRSVPPVTILAALADVYERPLNWFLENGRSLTDVRYRNVKSKVRVKDRHRFEGEAQRWLEAYTRIEQPPSNIVVAAMETSDTEEERDAHRICDTGSRSHRAGTLGCSAKRHRGSGRLWHSRHGNGVGV